ncbi:MAG: TonB C-terminal domain-containing protein [Burkholderiales bacterium]
MQAAQPEPGRIPSGMLAVGVHLAFFALLFFGVSWQTKIAEPIMVDLWEELPSEKPVPVVAPPPPPAPKPKVEVKPPPPPPPKVEAPSKADIELKAKPELERKRNKEEVEQKKLEEEKKKEEQRKQAEERLEEKKRADEERKLEQEARKREDALLEQKSKEDEKKRKDDELRRKRDAEQASAQTRLLEEISSRIRTKIMSKVVAPPGLTGNPEARYTVTVLPGGDVLDIKLVKSSGFPAWDLAVERAIKQSEPLPVPSQPELFRLVRILDLKFRPSAE